MSVGISSLLIPLEVPGLLSNAGLFRLGIVSVVVTFAVSLSEANFLASPRVRLLLISMQSNLICFSVAELLSSSVNQFASFLLPVGGTDSTLASRRRSLLRSVLLYGFPFLVLGMFGAVTSGLGHGSVHWHWSVPLVIEGSIVACSLRRRLVS